MKIEFDKSKGAEAFSGLVQGAVDLGKKAVDGTKAGVTAIVEKSKADEYARRLRKYNPLFPDQYQSETFHIPNIVVIVDDAVRKDIDVCEGAIGWLGKESGEEIFYLYDEAVAFSGIQFIPAPICNSVYYVDHFDRNRFIQADSIFKRNLEEKIAELQHIAECIGAKRCIIDICTSSKSTKSKNQSAVVDINAGSSKGNVTASQESTQKNSRSQKGHNEVVYKGLRFPKRPVLKWFLHDTSINNLIEACCTGKRHVKSYILELSGSSMSSMSQTTACAIDGVFKNALKVKSNVSLKTQATEEHESTLQFYVEF